MTTVHDFSADTIDGRSRALSSYRGKVLLIVNTASQCGFTPQYAGLEALYREYRDRGLEILGFPCNQFGAQEPGSESEIAKFCETRYGVSFPMFAKVEVNGDTAHPLFEWLRKEAPGLLGSQAIKWNFTKFLVDREGRAVARFAPTTAPADLAPAIEKLL
ncbi:MAG: glutathione peroxidase [Lautropia sp.]|nr:MAG: glutathione peroxidase [Pseudomonadota bacterium]MBC6960741.1 glutathione peroxidase [Lautropia sp.]MCL4700662.1 glutathione peroxidase [Burkholderiaceae bacterium]MDL1908599.1 glutathione peroxidase [Betaproteobacteria bacterium PRO1]RIK88001.1 MAG: glutathione peroxidase [Burkholderiales bacterium]